jgi:hypothetical protein
MSISDVGHVERSGIGGGGGSLHARAGNLFRVFAAASELITCIEV